MIDLPDFDNRARVFEPHPAADIGFVIAVGDDDFIAFANARQNRLREQKHEAGGGAAHDDFFIVIRVDELGDGSAGGQNFFRGGLRLRITRAELHAGGEQVIVNAISDAL